MAIVNDTKSLPSAGDVVASVDAPSHSGDNAYDIRFASGKTVSAHFDGDASGLRAATVVGKYKTQVVAIDRAFVDSVTEAILVEFEPDGYGGRHGDWIDRQGRSIDVLEVDYSTGTMTVDVNDGKTIRRVTLRIDIKVVRTENMGPAEEEEY